MANELRVVVDTGVVISAMLLPRSVPRQAFDGALHGGRLLISTATVEELNEVIRRPSFDLYLQEHHRLEFLAAMIREAELIPATDVVSECRDPRDDKFLELALSGKAACIISGDRDLLVLNPFRGIPVVSPKGFLERWPRSD